ncbi:MAG: hypothetical protein HY326_09765 [Chloroflexi bacterium]|nr:hypothetical protein [Chloroflexota bacterium]
MPGQGNTRRGSGSQKQVRGKSPFPKPRRGRLSRKAQQQLIEWAESQKRQRSN